MPPASLLIPSEVIPSNPDQMNLGGNTGEIPPIDFGMAAYRSTVRALKPQRHFGADGEYFEKPWEDAPKFRKWLEALGLGPINTEALLEIVPSVSLGMNHGSLHGVQNFIEANSDSGHKVLEAGFLLFGTGPNGDFIVVDIHDGSGRCGWLPMAMIWGMDACALREHFVSTNSNLGDFLQTSESDWAKVPKDWYQARERAIKLN